MMKALSFIPKKSVNHCKEGVSLSNQILPVAPWRGNYRKSGPRPGGKLRTGQQCRCGSMTLSLPRAEGQEGGERVGDTGSGRQGESGSHSQDPAGTSG